jgi:ribosome biogenesis GTPase A
MNERIRELAEQAKFTWAENDKDITGGVDLEKFAELIIADIRQIVAGLIVPETPEQDTGPYEHWNRALATVALEIEQHFYGDAHDAA